MKISFCTAFCLLALLGGCGQIGPLYLPENEPENQSVLQGPSEPIEEAQEVESSTE